MQPNAVVSCCLSMVGGEIKIYYYYYYYYYLPICISCRKILTNFVDETGYKEGFSRYTVKKVINFPVPSRDVTD
jgi:hypothetical protein